MPLLDCLRERSVVAGEVLQWHGESGDCVYIVESGQLEVIKDGVHVCFIGPGGDFDVKTVFVSYIVYDC
jgi:CRP-like cAMP-binding protein